MRKVSVGTVEIKVKVSAKAIEALRRGKVLHIKGEARFKPASGDAESVELRALARYREDPKGMQRKAVRSGSR